eukprot:s1595_g13.t1
MPSTHALLQRLTAVLFFKTWWKIGLQGLVDGLTATDKHTNLCRQSADGFCYGSVDIGAACTSWPCCICTTTEKQK